LEADPQKIARLRALLEQIARLTADGSIRWERQKGSAHRYARWNGNLLILGPDAASSGADGTRYLFITPFDSPDCIEINSSHAELGPLLLRLADSVERATAEQQPVDPFALTDDLLSRLAG
jgi:hypothetical protein